MTGKEKSKLFPQEYRNDCKRFLIENFSEIVDYNFTFRSRGTFDEIALGKLNGPDD